MLSDMVSVPPLARTTPVPDRLPAPSRVPCLMDVGTHHRNAAGRGDGSARHRHMASRENSSPRLATRVGDCQGIAAHCQDGACIIEGERANRFGRIQGDRISSRHSNVSGITARDRGGIASPVALGSPGSVDTALPVASCHGSPHGWKRPAPPRQPGRPVRQRIHRRGGRFRTAAG